jgi:hypothetical protein
MFFTPRVNPLIALAMVAALMTAVALDEDAFIYVMAGATFAFLLLSALLGWWEPPKR